MSFCLDVIAEQVKRNVWTYESVMRGVVACLQYVEEVTWAIDRYCLTVRSNNRDAMPRHIARYHWDRWRLSAVVGL